MATAAFRWRRPYASPSATLMLGLKRQSRGQFMTMIELTTYRERLADPWRAVAVSRPEAPQQDIWMNVIAKQA
jgi:hypothetical protein